MTGTTIASSMLIAALAFEPGPEDSTPILTVAEMERLESLTQGNLCATNRQQPTSMNHKGFLASRL
jgi:hypothetical protein